MYVLDRIAYKLSGSKYSFRGNPLISTPELAKEYLLVEYFKLVNPTGDN
jgi:hypothetical protein